MNTAPMSRRARRCRLWATSASSPSTITLAPISIRLSTPVPTSATGTGHEGSVGEHDHALDVPAQGRLFASTSARLEADSVQLE